MGIYTKSLNKIIKSVLSVLLIISLVFLVQSCNSTDPPPLTENSVTLTLFDVGVEEAYLHVSLERAAGSQRVTLQRDGENVLTFTASVTDTILADLTLTQNTSYRYKARITENNELVDESREVSLQTLTPGSRNIVWESYEFGERSSSFLNDAAIIDENTIWGVGNIKMNDSMGQPDPLLYNLVRWNGNEWTVERITLEYRSSMITPSMHGILSFSENDIWVSSGVPAVWNGTEWRQYHLFDMGVLSETDGSVLSIWGTSPNNIYFVGRLGSTVRYNGAIWEVLESGTETLIQDAWGVTNPITNSVEVYCAVSEFFTPKDQKLLKITNTNTVTELNWDTNRNPESIWTHKGYPFYVGGEGLFENKTGQWEEIDLGVNYSSNQIRGTGLNNVFVVGGFGLVAHYNGIDWDVIEELSLTSGNYSSVTINEGTIAIAGFSGNKGIIVIGRQN